MKNKRKIKVGSDFSGVGAFDQALIRLGIDYETVFACDMDKYARDTFIHNYGEPKYYPQNVYDREIPTESVDIYMTSPPCQAFSLAGKRLGKDDKRGILFFNSHEFIQVNKPRFFIFENVKGLLSDDGGKTFQEWVNMLGGKSVNGMPVIFPYEDAVPYHLYWKVLNAKHHGVPQNRERVFLIGIRDDEDNNFQFPKEEHLTKRLKDVLEENVDEKYFLSDKLMSWIDKHREKRDSSNKYPLEDSDISGCMTARYGKNGAEDPYVKIQKVGFINQDTQASAVYSENGLSQTMTAGTHGYAMGYVQVSKEVRTDESKKQRKKTGTNDFRGKEIEFREQDHMNTITTSLTNDHFLKVGTWRTHEDGKGFREIEDGNCPTIPARAREDGSGQPVVMQLNPSLESGGKQPYQQNRIYDSNAISPALNAGQQTWGGNIVTLPNNYKIRRLTPRECFRLMDFPDTFTWNVSDSQAYKQAENSIVVGVLEKIIKKLPL
jgi:DNA (cytosine-5)-methyltransferase 1